METAKPLATNIDRPLDDLIKESRQVKRAEIAAKRNTANKAKDPPATAAPVSKVKPAATKLEGGISKAAKRRAKRVAARTATAAAVALALEKELGSGPANPKQKRSQPMSQRLSTQVRKQPVVRRGVKVAVSNLHAGVTETDIAELFETVGPLKSAHLRMHADGRSACEAEVVFEAMGDALEAIKRYNKVPLDNQPLDITLATVSASNNEPVHSRMGKPRGRGQFNSRRKAHVDSGDYVDDASPQRNGFAARGSPHEDRMGENGGQTRRGSWKRFRRGRFNRPGMNGGASGNAGDRDDRGDRNSYDD